MRPTLRRTPVIPGFTPEESSSMFEAMGDWLLTNRSVEYRALGVWEVRVAKQFLAFADPAFLALSPTQTLTLYDFAAKGGVGYEFRTIAD